MVTKKAAAASAGTAIVHPANIVHTTIPIVGTAPLVINKFSAKAKAKMMADMTTPKAAKKSKKDREPRDFDADYASAFHTAQVGTFEVKAS